MTQKAIPPSVFHSKDPGTMSEVFAVWLELLQNELALPFVVEDVSPVARASMMKAGVTEAGFPGFAHLGRF